MPDANAAVTVRRLRAGDHDRWLELWRGYLHFYRAEVPDTVTELSFARLCDGTDGMLGLVAIVGEAPVGLAHLVFHGGTWTAQGFCYLEDLFVDPARRGDGVARALFEAVYAAAREQGCERVYWHTQQYNAPARSLYDTVGTPTSFIVYEHELESPEQR